MKKTIIFALTLLLLMGCRHHRAVSPRLVELDSLIAVAPDSAAALLQAIPDDSLPTAADRAYRALLLTQAKYKADIHAYRLDTINLAVNYYADGHDKDKRTRSLLYKGCVMEELPQLDSAMYCYLEANQYAEHHGQMRLQAYLLFRIAQLYQYSYTEDDKAIEYYRHSLGLYRQTGDSLRVLYCLSELAALYRNSIPDSVVPVALQASRLAQELGDDTYYCVNLETLAGHYLFGDDLRQAKALALTALSNPSVAPATALRCLNTACQAMAQLGEVDSAQAMLARIPVPATAGDSIDWMRSQALVAYAKGDLPTYVRLSGQRSDMADGLLVRSLQQKLIDIEKDSQLHIAEADSKLAQQHSRFIAILAIVLFLLVGIAFAFWQKRKKLEAVTKQNEINKLYLELKEISRRSESLSQQNKELSQENEELQALAKKVQQTESDLSTDKDYADLENERFKEKQLSKSLEYIAGLLHTFIQQSHELKPSEFMEKFRKGFLETPNGGEVDFWYTLRVQADQVHSGAVEKLLAEHPDLNETFIRVLCMSALGFSTEMMATCLQHNSDYIRTLKNRLKKKLDINCSIPEYLKQLGETR
jgi:uncharacterized protein YneF (UPF0154 family)